MTPVFTGQAQWTFSDRKAFQRGLELLINLKILRVEVGSGNVSPESIIYSYQYDDPVPQDTSPVNWTEKSIKLAFGDYQITPEKLENLFNIAWDAEGSLWTSETVQMVVFQDGVFSCVSGLDDIEKFIGPMTTDEKLAFDYEAWEARQSESEDFDRYDDERRDQLIENCFDRLFSRMQQRILGEAV